nr:PREDICTED: bone morphogenetic protein 2-like [Latimeria chalumnae]|eukprot:XP_014351052.1 PREDICTED: bone morphogenetic protein 2-like [Latimeria chalumnae]
MLHINKLTLPHRTNPHPYMKLVYHLLNSHTTRDSSDTEGTLVQSFRSIKDPEFSIPGWLWFNISHLKPAMTIAELVLLRKTLHPESLTVNVTVYSISSTEGNFTVSEALDEKVLTLDELSPSRYDIFNVSAILSQKASNVLGFQLRFTDDSGSLVLHEALTKSLYCLNTSSHNEPLLVTYRSTMADPYKAANLPEMTHSQYCTRGRRNLPEETVLKECSLHQHYVNFQTINLTHWVLEPAGFHVSFCRGSCFPKNGSLVKINKGSRRNIDSKIMLRLNKSHCVPQKWSSINIMYISQTEDIVIENLKDMKAESCVCST